MCLNAGSKIIILSNALKFVGEVWPSKFVNIGTVTMNKLLKANFTDDPVVSFTKDIEGFVFYISKHTINIDIS